MISEKEYKKVVYQLGERSHEVNMLLKEIARYMNIMLLVQEKLGITEHEVMRESFEVIEGENKS